MLVDNLVQFARVLRRAGIPVGPDRVLAGIAALEAVGVTRRDDVHAALAAVMLDRHEQQAVFDAAFEAFWRDPKLLERMMYLLLPKIERRGVKEPPKRPQRVQDALAASKPPAADARRAPPGEERTQFEATLTFSERERLQHADFESMSSAEFEAVKALVERLPPPFAPVLRRRREPAVRGSPDLRATLRRMTRMPHTLQLEHARARTELPAAVVLLDISGSMERYARIFLHYVHGLIQRRLRLQVFTFGTRLTNVTRALRSRDPDEALAACSAGVEDWAGGTRIASSLHQFNKLWGRRVLGQGAIVLLISDGLEREADSRLEFEMDRLHRSCRRLIWLNPLLRFEGFEAKAQGIRMMLPHVDEFRPVHNLKSMEGLIAALSSGQRPGRRPEARSAA